MSEKRTEDARKVPNGRRIRTAALFGLVLAPILSGCATGADQEHLDKAREEMDAAFAPGTETAIREGVDAVDDWGVTPTLPQDLLPQVNVVAEGAVAAQNRADAQEGLALASSRGLRRWMIFTAALSSLFAVGTGGCAWKAALSAKPVLSDPTQRG